MSSSLTAFPSGERIGGYSRCSRNDVHYSFECCLRPRTQTPGARRYYGEVTVVVVSVVVVCAGATVTTGGAGGYDDELYCVVVFFSTVPLLN
jgi:hypothetical protein